MLCENRTTRIFFLQVYGSQSIVDQNSSIILFYCSKQEVIKVNHNPFTIKQGKTIKTLYSENTTHISPTYCLRDFGVIKYMIRLSILQNQEKSRKPTSQATDPALLQTNCLPPSTTMYQIILFCVAIICIIPQILFRESFINYISFYFTQLMSLSRLKERLTQFKSQQNLRLVQQQYQGRRAHEITHPTNLLSRPKRQIESRLVTQINDKVTLSKEELKKYAKILKINAKPPISENKPKTNNINKPQYLNTIFTKRFTKDKVLSPNISKAAIKKQYNEVVPPLRHMVDKQKKGLKKAKQSKTHLKTEHNQSGILLQKNKKSKSREAISRKQSKKQLRKKQTQMSLQSTPSCILTEEVDMMQQIGEGTFGKVYRGKLKRNGEIVAVKKVLQDSRYKNREIQIIKQVKNDFICDIIGSYLTQEGNHEYLNIIMKYYQQNLFERIKSYPVGKMPHLQTKIILYQLFKGLSYLHSKHICHRDIKPQNLLLQGNSAAICDFGSAKIMLRQETNISYICARCYRAPELIFGSTRYTTQVDIWSAGCIILQILNGDPLFIGETSISHLLDIIKILGTPTKQQVLAMNPKYDIKNFKFPKYQRKAWKQIFPEADQLLLNLLSRVLVYSPHERSTAIQILSLQYFDEVRDELTYAHISSMYHLNDFFKFSKDQLAYSEHLVHKLIPQWYVQ